MKPIAAAKSTPAPVNTSPFVGVAKQRSVRKPSAATLEGPFSSLDIADAEELDTDDVRSRDHAARWASVNKTRTGKPMDDPSIHASQAGKTEEQLKRGKRGGKTRRKELAMLERQNGNDLISSPEAGRKG